MEKVIEGYAALFDVEYDFGDYIEVISPKAFARAKFDDVAFLRDHNPSLLLARNTAKTLKLQVDQRGLFFQAVLMPGAVADETFALVERGDLFQCSWGFSTPTTGSVWTARNGVPVRTIVEVKQVFDVSLVTYPANPQTKAWTRSDIKEFELSGPDVEFVYFDSTTKTATAV
jgi:HK97 family phage prohead protease